jgi:hypothetical protein
VVYETMLLHGIAVFLIWMICFVYLFTFLGCHDGEVMSLMERYSQRETEFQEKKLTQYLFVRHTTDTRSVL